MRKLFNVRVPIWGALVVVIVVGVLTLAAVFYMGRKTQYISEFPISVNAGNIGEFRYGEEPRFSDIDFFRKVKDEMIHDKSSFIEADLSAMQIRVYKGGVLTKEAPIRTKGREGSWWETPAGLYRVESKEKNHFSSFGKVYQPWSMAFQGNFFIHGWPYYPDGKPVSSSYSGGCIRLADEDAEAIYGLVEKGMPVLVFEKDFEPDNFQYHRRTGNLSAERFFAADLKNNFVFLQKDSSMAIPLGNFGQFIGSLAAAEYINIERKVYIDDNMIATTTLRLKAGQTVTPFDLLHLMMRESSNEPISVFEGILGVDRYAGLINGKAKAVGMRSTRWGSFSRRSMQIDGETTAEDLFYLAKYLHNNRDFLLKMSAGSNLGNTAYEESEFRTVQNTNLFSNDTRFRGGKYVANEDGIGDFMGIFDIQVQGENRPIFLFLGKSYNVNEDVSRSLSYIQNSFE